MSLKRQILYFMLICVLLLISFSYLTMTAPSAIASGTSDPLQYNASKTHPWLFFHNITQTDGYKYMGQEPWNSWYDSIKYNGDQNADSSLTFDFTADGGEAWDSRGMRAAKLALTYQISGGNNYRDKAIEALLNMNKGPEVSAESTGMDGRALYWWAFAYDLIQPSMNASEDMTVMDNMAIMCNASFWNARAHGPYGASWTDADASSLPGIGLGGLSIIDWKDPNHLGLTSNLTQWIGCGDQLFWQSDPYDQNVLRGRPVVDIGLAPDGQELYGGNYIHYSFQWIMAYAQAYSYYTGVNMPDVYPRLKGYMTEYLWETTPPGYLNNRMTSGGEYPVLVAQNWNLLDPANQSYVLAYQGRMDANQAGYLLPYSRGNLVGFDFSPISFVTYRNPQNVTAANPSWTTRIQPGSLQQTFRASWDNNSTWLSETTFSSNVNSSNNVRFDYHQDQLGIEWWSKGNPWLIDGSEDKYYGAYYGAFPWDHNVLMVENPRTPWSIDSATGLTARGLSKGSLTEGFNHAPATVNAITTAWMNASLSGMTATGVVNENASYEAAPIDAPITWERDILFPDNDYFLIVDRASSSKPWGYDTLFTPSTHDLVDSSSSLQNINLTLILGHSIYDWQSLPPQTATNTGLKLNEMDWQSSNIYGQAAQASLYTVPAGNLIVDKVAERGYGNENAQCIDYMPHVIFQQSPSNAMYRVTALTANLLTEDKPIVSTVSVSGTGNALSVVNGSITDITYSGTGDSSFASFTTDAETMFARMVNGKLNEYTIINATRMGYENKRLIDLSGKADYLTLQKGVSNITLKIKTIKTIDIVLSHLSLSSTYFVTRDGALYGGWTTVDGDTIKISGNVGEHSYEVIQGNVGNYTYEATPENSPATSDSLWDKILKFLHLK